MTADPDSHGSEPTAGPRPGRPGPYVLVLGALIAASAVLLLFYRLQIGFVFDDWSFVFGRSEGDIGDYLDPHNEHISVIPVAIYKLSLSVFGMGTNVPIQFASVFVFLLSVIVLFAYLRPLVGDAASTFGCAVVLFLGIASADLLFDFQIGFSLSIAAGIGALLMLRRDDETGDRWACLLLLVAMLSTSLGIPFAIGAGAHLLLHRERLAGRAYVVLVPIAAYGAWWIGWGHSASRSTSFDNLLHSPEYVYGAFRTAVSGLTGSFKVSGSWLDHLLAIGLLVAAALHLRRIRRIPGPLVVGAAIGFAFWFLAAINSAPTRGFAESRYQYPAVVFLLMILGGAFAGSRPGGRARLALAVVATVAVVANLVALNQDFDYYKEKADFAKATLTAVQLAEETVSPDLPVTLGELTDLPAGAYFEAVERYGSGGWSESEIQDLDNEPRQRIDQQAIAALPVRVRRVAGPPRGHCERAAASPGDPSPVPVAGSEFSVLPERPVQITLGRFGDGAEVGLAAAPAGKVTRVAIPRDRSDEPWRAGFVGSGPVTVCQ